MLNYIVFDGESTEHYHTYMTGAGIFDTPIRTVEKTAIDGRNGDLINDKGRYENVSAFYPIVVMEDFEKNKRELASKFSSKIGYKRLEDTFDADIYRMARFNGITNLTVKPHHDAGTFVLNFDCKPQKYLKVGERPIKVLAGSNVKLMNPTGQVALPLIKVTGTGTFIINGEEYTLLVNTSVVFVDSEIREIYEGNINRNNDFERYQYKMPTLIAGQNVIETDSGVSLEIIPRWFEIS